MHVGNWGALTLLGNATIVLRGENHVIGYAHNPGIYVPYPYTLTISGDGSLEASAAGNLDGGAAGIGAGENKDCGNITISGGTVAVDTIGAGAGIGSGRNGECLAITIEGGNVTASAVTGHGPYDEQFDMLCGAAIGAGDYGRSGTVEINGGIVTATGGSGAAAVGTGIHGSCPRVYVRSRHHPGRSHARHRGRRCHRVRRKRHADEQGTGHSSEPL